ncbi:MAG: TM2 domain-containing protein [Alphaproteobacteria bacterium]|jgi:TM2 domain-containing membrane protein YozV|uniref:TM2 domain-containing protein n=1 Tax=Maricaulis alexandrii TaxID=2570354 RepID=UPI00110816DA|nr:TM2 domain-containing protein [Maricaulis alexandrii]MCR9266438.1 TM2 domain-containing protein [Alphaproteobacteria bacterium]
MNSKTYTMELANIINGLPEANRASFITAFQASEKNPLLIFGFGIFLGGLGIDRMLVGDVVAGILKLITFGGLGLWQIIDWFLIGGRTRDKNIALARSMAASFNHAPAAPAAAAATAAPAAPVTPETKED